LGSVEHQRENANPARRNGRPAWVRILNSPPFRAITTGLMALAALAKLTAMLATIFRE
jgi:hypothetical protein